VVKIEPVAPVDAAWLDFTESQQRKQMGNLIVEDDIEEGTVHAQCAIVVNEA
jgi:hypothetical protein